MLIDFDLKTIGEYITKPEYLPDGSVKLTTGQDGYPKGAGVATIAQRWSNGETLQWGVLAESPSGDFDVYLGISWGDGKYPPPSWTFGAPGEKKWLTSPPINNTEYRDKLFVLMYRANKGLKIHRLFLGDPISVTNAIQLAEAAAKPKPAPVAAPVATKFSIAAFLSSLFPMMPTEGPPLPRLLNIRWPGR